MQEKKNTPRWRVSCLPREDGWVRFIVQRTDVRKRRRGQITSIDLSWSGERFADNNGSRALAQLTKSEREGIMRQMREILERGLPTAPADFPGAYLEAS